MFHNNNNKLPANPIPTRVNYMTHGELNGTLHTMISTDLVLPELQVQLKQSTIVVAAGQLI